MPKPFINVPPGDKAYCKQGVLYVYELNLGHSSGMKSILVIFVLMAEIQMNISLSQVCWRAENSRAHGTYPPILKCLWLF